ncbi:ABC transporter substrate-binding protein [Actinoplanes subtropicus]|uniref:ABC transporter substrate-binding protein n=1 Tax=Actinoplanes subtropicus TaxID=543632 RepID=UPI0004C39076|nr:ABC transporter substrate-binding protein [Actinoplanes subtropicus]
MSEVFTRRRAAGGLTGLAAAMALVACSGAPAPQPAGSAAASAPTSGFTVLSPAPTADAGDLTWATYRETQTLDPIKAFDYPENTVDPLLCDALLRQKPDLTIGDGLAKVTTTSPTRFDFTINSAATFWDGSPVTAKDAVFSLKRAADPAAGGFYSEDFTRVSAIEATGDKTFRITLKQPDYWLLSELSAAPGEILQQAYVQAKGENFGTVSGGTMCSGPFKLDSWKTGQGVKVVPNPSYWDTSLPKPRLKSLTIAGVPDDASFTAGVKTGALSGGYVNALSTLGQLESDPSVKVYQGAPSATAALVISATKGPLADPKVRQAISYGIDRQGIISTVYRGAANLPHAIAASGTWGYAPDTFAQAYADLPELSRDAAKSQELAKPLDLAGQSITIGTSSGIPSLHTLALAVKAAAEAIGLEVTMKNVSPANYVNFFTDPKAFGSVDAFPTMNYGDFADPAALYRTFALAGATQNFDSWTNPEVTRSLEASRGEANPVKRAEDVVAAQKIITEQLVWIPLAAPNTVLVMNKAVTGAPATFQYMAGPWAVTLGGTR